MAATLLFFILLAVAVILLSLLLALYLVPVTISMVADCRRESARVMATVAWGIVGGGSGSPTNCRCLRSSSSAARS